MIVALLILFGVLAFVAALLAGWIALVVWAAHHVERWDPGRRRREAATLPGVRVVGWRRR